MKKHGRMQRAVCALLALALTSSLAACGGPAQESKSVSAAAPAVSGTGEGSGVDLSEKVDLVLYVTGNTPDFFDKIQSKLNELTTRDLNCTVQYNFFNTTDNQQKYMLLLSSGEPVDLLYSANYLNYSANAMKGAFQELDELVPKYSPKLWDYVGEDGWQAAKVNGKIYMIPCMWKEYNLFGFTYREDLREKHNLPMPDSVENIEAYLQGIKDNEPDMMPTGEIVQPSAVANLGNYFRAFEVFDSKYRWVDWRMPYGLYIDYDDATKINYYWESDNFREDMKLMKKWADAGYWSKNALSDTTEPKDKMLAGTVAAQIGTTGFGAGIDYTKEAKQNDPNTTMVFNTVPYADGKGLAVAVHPTQNGFSVPITAQHPDRAIALWEKLVLEKEYFDLTQYGIEGEDYKVTDGAYEEIPGGFKREATRLWAARNDELYLPGGNWKELQPYKDEFAKMEGPNKMGGFVEDTTPYQAERAALMNVVSQYLIPLQAGLVDDVDKATDELLKQAEAAGVKKVHDEYQKQWLAYVEANNNWEGWKP